MSERPPTFAEVAGLWLALALMPLLRVAFRLRRRKPRTGLSPSAVIAIQSVAYALLGSGVGTLVGLAVWWGMA